MNDEIVVCSDAVKWLDRIPPESVDLVVTDPAYESLEKHRAKGTTTRLRVSDGSSNEWFPIFPNERFPELLAALFRVLKIGTHCYIMCDQETMFLVHDEAPKVGFKWHKFLVWDKMRPGLGYHYRATHEVICFLEKGTRKGDARGCLNDNSTADVLREELIDEIRDWGALLEHQRVKGYPTEKPVSLSAELIRMSSRLGDLIIDPFAGSCSSGVAARQLGRRWKGCDIKPAACELGRRRLDQQTGG